MFTRSAASAKRSKDLWQCLGEPLRRGGEHERRVQPLSERNVYATPSADRICPESHESRGCPERCGSLRRRSLA